MSGDSFVRSLKGEAAMRGKVLVFPLLSVGNVPQIAVDLLVNSFALARVGVVADASVAPMASSSLYLHSVGGLSFACELFQFGEDVVLLQLRSRLLPGQMGLFCARLAALASARGMELCVLGSADSGWLVRPDEERLAVKAAASAPHAAAVLRDMGLRPLQWDQPQQEATHSMRQAVFGRNTLADLLLKHAAAANIPTTELVLFCAEGENVPGFFCLFCLSFLFVSLVVYKFSIPLLSEGVLLAQVLVAYLTKRNLLSGNHTTLSPIALPAWSAIVRDDNPETIRLLFQ